MWITNRLVLVKNSKIDFENNIQFTVLRIAILEQCTGGIAAQTKLHSVRGSIHTWHPHIYIQL